MDSRCLSGTLGHYPPDGAGQYADEVFVLGAAQWACGYPDEFGLCQTRHEKGSSG